MLHQMYRWVVVGYAPFGGEDITCKEKRGPFIYRGFVAENALEFSGYK
jgi:hypothetical protein